MTPRTKHHTEHAFESSIEAHLLAHGYAQGDAAVFDAKLALFPAEVLAFIQATQPRTWSDIERYHGANASSGD